MGTTTESVPVSSTVLNPRNYRHRVVESEREALGALFADNLKRAEMHELAADITQRGLDPSSLPILEPVDGYWRVLEGNRRLAVLKVLANPDVLPDLPGMTASAMKSYREKFAKLGAIAAIPRKILCVVTDDRAYAEHLIMLKHTGSGAHKGAGTILWDTEGRARYEASLAGANAGAPSRASNSQTADALALLDALQIHFAGDAEVDELIGRAKAKRGLTTLGRLLIKPENQARLGVQIDAGSVRFIMNRDALRLAVVRILTEVGTPALNSRSTNTAKDVVQYLDDIQDDLPRTKDRLAAAEEASAPPAGGGTAPSKRRRRRQPTPMRTPFQNLNLYHASAKTRALLAEMKQLKIDDNAHVLAACNRTLIDLYTADVLAALSEPEEDSPSKRARKCLELLDPPGTRPRDRRFPLIANQLAAQTGELAIDTMNGYMHRANYHPTPDTVRIQVEYYQPWMQSLDEHVEEQLTSNPSPQKP